MRHHVLDYLTTSTLYSLNKTLSWSADCVATQRMRRDGERAADGHRTAEEGGRALSVLCVPQGAAKKAQTGTKQLKKAAPVKQAQSGAKQAKKAFAAPIKRAVPKTNKQGTRTAGYRKFQGAAFSSP